MMAIAFPGCLVRQSKHGQPGIRESTPLGFLIGRAIGEHEHDDASLMTSSSNRAECIVALVRVGALAVSTLEAEMRNDPLNSVSGENYTLKDACATVHRYDGKYNGGHDIVLLSSIEGSFSVPTLRNKW